MNEVINQDIIPKEKTAPIIPELLKINWKKSDDLNFNFSPCIKINGKNKKITDIIIIYQKLKIANVSGGGIDIIEFKPGISIYGDSRDMMKLKDSIDMNWKFLSEL